MVIVKCTFSYIKVKEITIQDGLHDSRNNYNPIQEIFCVVTVNPIKYV